MPLPRFRIRTLMIAVAVVALLLPFERELWEFARWAMESSNDHPATRLEIALAWLALQGFIALPGAMLWNRLRRPERAEPA